MPRLSSEAGILFRIKEFFLFIVEIFYLFVTSIFIPNPKQVTRENANPISFNRKSFKPKINSLPKSGGTFKGGGGG